MPVVLTDESVANKTTILWNNYLTFPATVISAGGATEGNPVENIAQEATYNFWQAPDAFSAITFFDFGIARSTSALGISGHTIATSGVSLVVLRYSTDGVTWVPLWTHTPTTNEDLLYLFPAENYRYWSVNFQGAAPIVSNMFLGPRLEFPYTPIEGYRPTHHSRKYTKYFNNSIEGHLLGNRVMSSGGTTTVEFPDLDRAFVDGPMRSFEDHYNRGRSFFYAGWPGGKPQDVAYAWADGEDAMIDVAYTNGSKRASVGFGMGMFYGR